MVPLPEGYSRQSKANLYEVNMTSLQGAIKWSHERFRYFLINIDIYYDLGKRNCVVYRYNVSPLLRPLTSCEILKLSLIREYLMIYIRQEYRSLRSLSCLFLSGRFTQVLLY